MTQNMAAPQTGARLAPARKGGAPALSLKESVPSEWHHDRPAYAGDPDMDWINLPEPPQESRWGIKETPKN